MHARTHVYERARVLVLMHLCLGFCVRVRVWSSSDYLGSIKVSQLNVLLNTIQNSGSNLKTMFFIYGYGNDWFSADKQSSTNDETDTAVQRDCCDIIITANIVYNLLNTIQETVGSHAFPLKK